MLINYQSTIHVNYFMRIKQSTIVNSSFHFETKHELFAFHSDLYKLVTFILLPSQVLQVLEINPSRDSKSNHTSIYVEGEIHKNIFIFLTAKAVLEIAFTPPPPPPLFNSVKHFCKFYLVLLDHLY
jgi:hypothetical protein